MHFKYLIIKLSQQQRLQNGHDYTLHIPDFLL